MTPSVVHPFLFISIILRITAIKANRNIAVGKSIMIAPPYEYTIIISLNFSVHVILYMQKNIYFEVLNNYEGYNHIPTLGDIDRPWGEAF